MASQVVEALFTAQEDLSEALDNITQSTGTLDETLDKLEQELTDAFESGNLLRDASERLGREFVETASDVQAFDEASEQLDRTLRDVAEGNIEAEHAAEFLEQQYQDLVEAGMAVERSTSSFEEELADLRNEGAITDHVIDELGISLAVLGKQGRMSGSGIEALQRALVETTVGTENMQRTTERLNREVSQLTGAAQFSSGALDELVQTFVRLSGSGRVSDEKMREMRSTLTRLAASGALSESQLEALSRANLKVAVTSAGAQSALDEVADEADDVTTSAAGAATSLGVLSAVAGATSFEFSSLSVNIGPFNLALKNLMIQLPAIITGMGTLLAIVTAMATAFLTLGLAFSAFVAAGAVSFFQDFSEQFEDTMEAVEALTRALVDLFTQAIQPLANEANVDLFIDFVDFLARLVNRISQAFAQMRDEVMGFGDDVGGDLDQFFTALRDVIVMLEPVLERFLSFFAERLPDALRFFARVTLDMADPLSELFDAFRRMFNQLVTFASTLINGVFPVLSFLINALADLFQLINMIPSSVLSLTFTLLGLAAAGWKVHSMMVGLHGILQVAWGAMLRNAFAGDTLSIVMTDLVEDIGKVIAGELSLTAAIKTNIAAMRQQIVSSKLASASFFGMLASLAASTVGLLANAAAWIAVRVASLGLVDAIAIVVGGLVLLGGALKALMGDFDGFGGSLSPISGIINHIKNSLILLVDILLGMLTPAMNIAIGVFDLFAAPVMAIVDGIAMVAEQLGLLSSKGEETGGVISTLRSIFMPVIELLSFAGEVVEVLLRALGQIIAFGIGQIFEFWAGAIGMVIGKIQELIPELGLVEGAVSLIGDVIDGLNERLDDFIEFLNTIPGVDIEGPTIQAEEARQQLTSEEEEQEGDDIQTEADVNLSFEDSIEQNIDVQADPEEREQMRRVVKDALNEANSIARRQQGHPG